jgi:hypothetical protein
MNDFIPVGDALFDNVVQVGKGFANHEKKSLQAIHAIDAAERTTVGYLCITNLVGDAKVALIEELLEVAASQCFVRFQ